MNENLVILCCIMIILSIFGAIGCTINGLHIFAFIFDIFSIIFLILSYICIKRGKK